MASSTARKPEESTAYLGIGSNLDPETHILKAIPKIGVRLQLVTTSRFYRNPAYHPDPCVTSLPPFINGVLEVRTDMDPVDLKFEVLREIERDLGRKRSPERYAARVLDLDLLVYGSLRRSSPELVLPDPEVFLRPFLAVPLCELLPHLRERKTGRTLALVVKGMDTSSLRFDEQLTLAVQEAVRGVIAGRPGLEGKSRWGGER